MSTSTKTSNMKVDAISFLLERLSRDCAPLQYIRELTENALEAIQRLLGAGGGEVYWGLNLYALAKFGYEKLCIIDTGVGMSGDEMVQHINHLSSSGGNQSFTENYGVGAKIAAATHNKAGIIYASWTSPDDPGAMIHLWRDPETQEYGLKRFEVDGEFVEFAVPEADIKPQLIKDAGHGTVVILLGDEDDQNTRVPEGISSIEWVAKYLEERYFIFPDNITVRAQDSRGFDETAKYGSQRPVYGRKYALADISKSGGEVKLTNATARWWILDNTKKAHSTRRFQGYTAALYQNELYEPTTTALAKKLRLQSFGCVFSHGSVVIYVEPHASDELTTNTARTALLLENESLPWSEWAAEFRDKLPEEIRALEDEMASASVSGNSAEMEERLRRIMPFFDLSRYRPVQKDGTHDITTPTMMGGTTPTGKRSKRTINPNGKSGVTGDKRGTIQFGIAAKEGTTAVEVKSKQIPQVKWLPPPELDETIEDRAAYFVPESNLIMANSQFVVFTDMIDHWKKQYANVAGAEPVIVDTVREAYAQQLIETILGVQSLIHRRHWTEVDINDSWKAEALTAAVMSRTQVITFVKRQLQTKLGGKADAASA